MKLAVVALTQQGAMIAGQIQRVFPETDLYLLDKAAISTLETHSERFTKLRELVPKLWTKYQGIVFIMAAGIVVRQIAPFIQRKDRDPAVIVIDEKGEYVIPILSGHLGGGNALARELAQELKARPVITTATDLWGLVAPDEYARRLHWRVYPLTRLPEINRRLLKKQKLRIYSEYVLDEDHPLRQDPSYEFTFDKDKADIRISLSISDEKALTLIPPLHHVGIGCRKGVSTEDVLAAIATVFQRLGYSPQSINGLYSISVKAEEQGLQNAAAALGVAFKTFSPAQIQGTIEKYNLARSAWVRKSIGVDGVCEPASLLGSKDGQLLLPKTRVGKVTIAVCQEKSIS